MRFATTLPLLVLGSLSTAQLTASKGLAPEPPYERTPFVASFGGAGFDEIRDVAPAVGGGYLLCGVTRSFGAGMADGWVAKLSASGAPRWEIAIGASADEELQALAPTPDGGALLVGSTRTPNGDTDGWMLRLAGSGAIRWQMTFGMNGDDSFGAVATIPGGFVIGGTLTSPKGDADAWLMAIDDQGLLQWQQTFADTGDERVSAVAATPNGIAVVAGSNSALGQASGVAFSRPWMMVLDFQGAPIWQRTYDYSGGDVWGDIEVLADGFIVAGEIAATGFFRGDAWILRLDTLGNVVWDARYGDHTHLLGFDNAAAVEALPNGQFAVLGSTETGGPGGADLWILRLDAQGNLLSEETFGGVGYDLGQAMCQTPDGGLLLAGYAQPEVPFPADALVVRLDSKGRPGRGCELQALTNPGFWNFPIHLATTSVPPIQIEVLPQASAMTLTQLSSHTLVCPTR